MGFPKDLGLVGLIVALVFTYFLGVFTNLTTPLVGSLIGKGTRALADWFSTWSKASLERRIGKLESKLGELEKEPPIDPVQNETLWAIKSVKIHTNAVGTGVVLAIYFGIMTVANTKTTLFGQFTGFVVFILVFSLVQSLTMRYERDFRWLRAPSYREKLRKSIKELKELRQKWDTDMPGTRPQ